MRYENQSSLLEKMLINKLVEDTRTSEQNVTNRLMELCFFGNKILSLVFQSVISSSIPRKLCENQINQSYELLSNEKKTKIKPSKRKMGQVKFKSLRKTYNVICKGKYIPKYNYKFCVDTKKY